GLPPPQHTVRKWRHRRPSALILHFAFALISCTLFLRRNASRRRLGGPCQSRRLRWPATDAAFAQPTGRLPEREDAWLLPRSRAADGRIRGAGNLGAMAQDSEKPYPPMT